MTIGEADDLRAAELDDVRAFFQTYYHPRNASLAIAGDVDTERGAGAGERLLRTARGRRRAAAGRAPRRRRRSARERRLLLEDRVELPRLYIGLAFRRRCSPTAMPSWISPPTCWPTARPRASIDALVYDQRIATEIAASQNSREIGGFFQIVATAAPGRTLAELERGDHRARSRGFAAEGPTRGRDGALPGAGRGAASSTGCRRSAASAASPIS